MEHSIFDNSPLPSGSKRHFMVDDRCAPLGRKAEKRLRVRRALLCSNTDVARVDTLLYEQEMRHRLKADPELAREQFQQLLYKMPHLAGFEESLTALSYPRRILAMERMMTIPPQNTERFSAKAAMNGVLFSENGCVLTDVSAIKKWNGICASRRVQQKEELKWKLASATLKQHGIQYVPTTTLAPNGDIQEAVPSISTIRLWNTQRNLSEKQIGTLSWVVTNLGNSDPFVSFLRTLKSIGVSKGNMRKFLEKRITLHVAVSVDLPVGIQKRSNTLKNLRHLSADVVGKLMNDIELNPGPFVPNFTLTNLFLFLMICAEIHSFYKRLMERGLTVAMRGLIFDSLGMGLTWIFLAIFMFIIFPLMTVGVILYINGDIKNHKIGIAMSVAWAPSLVCLWLDYYLYSVTYEATIYLHELGVYDSAYNFFDPVFGLVTVTVIALEFLARNNGRQINAERAAVRKILLATCFEWFLWHWTPNLQVYTVLNALPIGLYGIVTHYEKIFPTREKVGTMLHEGNEAALLALTQEPTVLLETPSSRETVYGTFSMSGDEYKQEERKELSPNHTPDYGTMSSETSISPCDPALLAEIFGPLKREKIPAPPKRTLLGVIQGALRWVLRTIHPNPGPTNGSATIYLLDLQALIQYVKTRLQTIEKNPGPTKQQKSKKVGQKTTTDAVLQQVKEELIKINPPVEPQLKPEKKFGEDFPPISSMLPAEVKYTWRAPIEDRYRIYQSDDACWILDFYEGFIRYVHDYFVQQVKLCRTAAQPTALAEDTKLPEQDEEKEAAHETNSLAPVEISEPSEDDEEQEKKEELFLAELFYLTIANIVGMLLWVVETLKNWGNVLVAYDEHTVELKTFATLVYTEDQRNAFERQGPLVSHDYECSVRVACTRRFFGFTRDLYDKTQEHVSMRTAHEFKTVCPSGDIKRALQVAAARLQTPCPINRTMLDITDSTPWQLEAMIGMIMGGQNATAYRERQGFRLYH